MAPKLLTRETLPQFTQRFGNIRADSSRLWGKMAPPQMLSHVRRSAEISLGEVPVDIRLNWFLRTVGPTLFFRILPFPKGKIKALPEFLAPWENDVDLERARALATIERFVAVAEQEPNRLAPSPFGPLPLSFWQLIHAKHFDHHLRQFGV